MDFDSEWARCAPWLQAALDEGPPTHTLEDVKACIERREAMFWAGRKAAMVTEINIYPRCKALHFWLAGGDLAELRDELRPMAEAHAVRNGCQFVSIAGRRGWSRALGYRPVHYTCVKELLP